MNWAPWQLFAAYLLDLAAGDPRWMPHPVRWIGSLIAWAERVLYPKAASPAQMRFAGFALWVLVLSVVLVAAKTFLVLSTFPGAFLGSLAAIWLAYTTLATRCLHDEARQVAEALCADDIALARSRLSFIVSRETAHLDSEAILRALVETVSENFSDGIVAPLFYLAIGGPLGAIVYKAVNTMDSMLGYKNERYRFFGSFAARADDVANWIPARISGWLMVSGCALLGMDWRRAAKTMRRDAPKMKSPNAGYPEAAAAGGLGVRLGGAGRYFGTIVEKPFLGDPIAAITMETYQRMIRLMYLGSGLAFVAALLILSAMRIV
ncbi:MAG: adenosylcobinamide-phosphate synthase CbiB [Syntrophobacteraceae bacterium]